MCCARLCRIIGQVVNAPPWARARKLGYDYDVESTSPEMAFRRLVDDYRTRCLWFLREDYYPETSSERERILSLIAQHGDQEAFRRAAEVRTWLSRRSSATSAGS